MYDRTIDWESFWTDDLPAFDHELMYNRSHEAAELLIDLFTRRETPMSVASIGCGPAVCLLDIASTYPDMECYGFDSARSVVEQARQRAIERDIENIQFYVDPLPNLEAERQFECVYCFNTLHYVAEVEQAIEALWERTASGGILVVNYPTPATKAAYEEEFADPDDALLGDHDEEWLEQRNELILAGENLLTPSRIGELLGQEPQFLLELIQEHEVDPDSVSPLTVLEK